MYIDFPTDCVWLGWAYVKANLCMARGCRYCFCAVSEKFAFVTVKDGEEEIWIVCGVNTMMASCSCWPK